MKTKYVLAFTFITLFGKAGREYGIFQVGRNLIFILFRYWKGLMMMYLQAYTHKYLHWKWVHHLSDILRVPVISPVISPVVSPVISRSLSMADISGLSKMAEPSLSISPTSELESTEKPLVIVLHGLAGACSPTRYLTLYLQQEGLEATTIDYPARGQGISENAAHVVDQIVERGLYARTLHIVGHSLGGLIAREVSHDERLKVQKLVTLGTPHTGAVAVERLHLMAPRLRSLGDLVHATLGKSGSQLTPDHVQTHLKGNNDMVRTCGIAAVLIEPLTGPSSLLMFDRGEDHDGRVLTTEATQEWMEESHIVYQCSHGLMPVHPATQRIILSFLMKD